MKPMLELKLQVEQGQIVEMEFSTEAEGGFLVPDGMAWARLVAECIVRFIREENEKAWNRDRRANEASMAGENYELATEAA